jgi:hypothetical protein
MRYFYVGVGLKGKNGVARYRRYKFCLTLYISREYKTADCVYILCWEFYSTREG